MLLRKDVYPEERRGLRLPRGPCPTHHFSSCLRLSAQGSGHKLRHLLGQGGFRNRYGGPGQDCRECEATQTCWAPTLRKETFPEKPRRVVYSILCLTPRL